MKNKLVRPILAAVLVTGMLWPSAQSAFAASPQAASSPEKPLSYTNTWQTIKPGEWQWYTFKYNHTDTKHDENENSAETSSDVDGHVVPADIQLFSRPIDGVTLTLLNGDQVRAWEQGQPLAHFGAATDVVDTTKKSESLARFCRTNMSDPACSNSSIGSSQSGTKCVNTPTSNAATARCEELVRNALGYANWSGDLGATGTYYILVQRAANASGPAQYRFTINGDGVTLK
jgi:hypothetical protein